MASIFRAWRNWLSRAFFCSVMSSLDGYKVPVISPFLFLTGEIASLFRKKLAVLSFVMKFTQPCVARCVIVSHNLFLYFFRGCFSRLQDARVLADAPPRCCIRLSGFLFRVDVLLISPLFLVITMETGLCSTAWDNFPTTLRHACVR